ncbi:hypothetical protein RHGRI_021052 [Rhododendron griersonianum]|uniref:Uncharacterized protein n=1 Tax=Rhododendron griersonianum TaxID=479676 RepID=A0AAV6JIQ6_9ERIC|nr:hypothetical protein RHGRI_021052 [Rhododendron griersonianum]
MGSITEDKIGAIICCWRNSTAEDPTGVMPLEKSAQQSKDFNSPCHVSAPVPFDHVWH